MNIEIYTDGACSKNPGPGGWAYIMVNKDSKEEIYRENGGEKSTTNNRMELMAVIRAWIFNWKKNNWKTASKQPVKNQDLWQELDSLSASIKPEWIWVKGHAGNPLNEACDRLAVEACQKMM